MDESRFVKHLIFSDALEGQRKSGTPHLSWRHPIAQDLKSFGYQSVYVRMLRIFKSATIPMHWQYVEHKLAGNGEDDFRNASTWAFIL